MRANSTGPLCPAACAGRSDAVRFSGTLHSALGMILVRCATASHSVATLVPSGSMIGSENRKVQDTTDAPFYVKLEPTLFGATGRFALEYPRNVAAVVTRG